MRAIVLASTAVALCSAALAYDPVADTRKIMAGTVTTTSIKNEYLSGKRDNTTPFKGALAAYKAVREAEKPPVPPPPPPPPPPTDVITPSLSGLPSIPSNFDRTPLLQTYPVAISAAPDVLGAFRFTCKAGQLLKDDPIVYPGQPGKSHLHQFFGNTAANARSTYQSLRTTGDSTCNNPLNRSAYWMPAMTDGQTVYKPDILIYYKRRPKSDPKCQGFANGGEGTCVPLPNGLRYIFGFDMVKRQPGPVSAVWYCSTMSGTVIASPAGVSKHPSFDVVMPYCQVGQRLLSQLASPNCWSGTHLDTANHQDHMAYMVRDRMTGRVACPPSHPYVVATFTQTTKWDIDQAMKDAAAAGKLYLSSDKHIEGARPGTTAHNDWWGAWDDGVKFTWEEDPQGCINGLRNCSSGNLGNGTRMTDPAAVKFGSQPMRVAIPAS